MRQIVGFSQRIKRAWLDAVLDKLVETKIEAELRSFLDEFLKAELPGKSSRADSTGIILRIWSGIPPERVFLRDRAIAMLPRISGQERIWLHWGMTAMAYPFFRDTVEVVGRLLALQDDFTSAQVQGRMLTTWGDRATSKEAGQKLIRALVDWEVLRSTKTKGHFLLARKMTASIPELQIWLLEALLCASESDEIEAQQLLRLPESFPFTITVGVSDLRRYEGFNIHRQGLDMDMVALRPFRAPQPIVRTNPPVSKPPLEPTPTAEPIEIEVPTPKPETSNRPVAKSIQTTLFDNLIEDVPANEKSLEAVKAAASNPKSKKQSGLAASKQTFEIIQRFDSDRELLKSTVYAEGGLNMLFAKLQRAAMNQAEGREAATSCYAIWTNTVRDHISEAMRLIRENGDQIEAERLLTAAHNSLSAFSEVQSIFDRLEVGQPMLADQNSVAKTSPKKATKTKAKKEAKPKEAGADPLLESTSKAAPSLDAVELAKLEGMKALSIRQPNVEAIFRGKRTVEHRSAATKIRGRILIYSSLSRFSQEKEAEMMENCGIDDVSVNDLPRGVLVGTVELHDSDGGEWYFRDPERLEIPVKPTKQPKPVWFNPF